MLDQQIVDRIKFYFPKFNIKFKNESLLMKIIGFLMFYNKKFMTQYATTLGNTIYFPNDTYVSNFPLSTVTVVLHELVHIKDSKKLGPLFTFLYLSPQSLIVLFIPLLFLSWKIALLSLLFFLPIPSFFRMYFEKRAYFASLYTMKKLSKLKHFNVNLNSKKISYIEQFKNSSYYFMWPFSNIDKSFDEAINKIEAGDRPYDDKIFDILDDILSKV